MATQTWSPTALGTNAWTDPANAYSSNDSYATATPGKSTDVAGIWKTFGMSDPAPDSVITKVEIGCEWVLDTSLSIFTLRMRASYDNGSNWTSYVDDTDEQTSEALVWYDVTDGHSWTWSELSDTYFLAEVTASQGNSKTAVTCSLDHVQVRITYQDAPDPCEVYAAEAILDYEVRPCEVYAAEAILDYVAPTDVYAAEAILDYEVPPCEVYAAEAVLDYVAPAEVYAAEAILDFNAACEVYAAEAILDYTAPAEVYAAEAVLDYEVPPCEVYAAEAILDYTAPAEVYASEAILDYIVPTEVYAAEAILDYALPEAEGGGSPGAFRWPYMPVVPEAAPERVTKPKHIRITDHLDLTDDVRIPYVVCVVKDEIDAEDHARLTAGLRVVDGAEATDSAVMRGYLALKDDIQTTDNVSIFATIPERHTTTRGRDLEVAETVRLLARGAKVSGLRRRMIRAKDPSLTSRVEAEYARELGRLFLAFKRDAAKILGRRELSDDWDEVDAPDLMDKFERTIEVTITIPGRGIVRRFTTRAYTAGGLRSTQFLNSVGVKAVFSILPADQAALDILITRDLSGLKGITDEMSKQIMAEITDGMLRGDSMATVARAIDDRIDSIGRARAVVLARTETMKAFNEGALTQYDKHGITEVEWLASPGERTCDECMGYDGQKFPIDGHPDCPAHPNCRCVLLPVIPEIGA